MIFPLSPRLPTTFYSRTEGKKTKKEKWQSSSGKTWTPHVKAKSFIPI